MTTKTFDHFHYIGFSLFGVALMLGLIYVLGDVHGLIVTVIILIGQIAQLSARTTKLQRQLNVLRQEQGSAEDKIVNKVERYEPAA